MIHANKQISRQLYDIRHTIERLLRKNSGEYDENCVKIRESGYTKTVESIVYMLQYI